VSSTQSQEDAGSIPAASTAGLAAQQQLLKRRQIRRRLCVPGLEGLSKRSSELVDLDLVRVRPGCGEDP
jgi:hypothetical protein